MGGCGSGRRASGAKRPSTDDARGLDVRRLARRGGLAPGAHVYVWPSAWGDSGVAYRVDGDEITLAWRERASLRDESREVRQAVGLTWTPCNLGGRRPWFACPGCGGRVAVLYLMGGAFRCPRCHGLAYASTREDRARRVLRKANRLREDLGGVPAFGEIPRRPPWLSRRRWWRAVERIVELDEAYAAAVLPRVEALMERMGGDEGVVLRTARRRRNAAPGH